MAKTFKVSTEKRGDGFTEYTYTAKHEGTTTRFTVVKQWTEDGSTVWDLVDHNGAWVDSGARKGDLVAWGKEVAKPVDDAAQAFHARLNARLDAGVTRSQVAPLPSSFFE